MNWVRHQEHKAPTPLPRQAVLSSHPNSACLIKVDFKRQQKAGTPAPRWNGTWSRRQQGSKTAGSHVSTADSGARQQQRVRAHGVPGKDWGESQARGRVGDWSQLQRILAASSSWNPSGHSGPLPLLTTGDIKTAPAASSLLLLVSHPCFLPHLISPPSSPFHLHLIREADLNSPDRPFRHAAVSQPLGRQLIARPQNTLELAHACQALGMANKTWGEAGGRGSDGDGAASLSPFSTNIEGSRIAVAQPQPISITILPAPRLPFLTPFRWLVR